MKDLRTIPVDILQSILEECWGEFPVGTILQSSATELETGESYFIILKFAHAAVYRICIGYDIFYMYIDGDYIDHEVPAEIQVRLAQAGFMLQGLIDAFQKEEEE